MTLPDPAPPRALDYPPEKLADIKDKIVQGRGYWAPFHEGLLKLDPNFLEAYYELNNQPYMTGVLPRKVKEFVYVAIDASVNHLYEPGIRRHIGLALDHGATRQEMTEVLEIICSMVHHTSALGFQALLDAGAARPPRLSGAQQAQKDAFAALVGDWPLDWIDKAFELNAPYAAALLRFLAAPWQSGALEPKVREFVYLGVNAAPTTLFKPAIDLHTRRALACGATEEEIGEVLQLAAGLGIHTCSIAVPPFVEILKERGMW